MSFPNALPKLVAVALVALTITACSTYKEPAEEAVATIDEKLAGIHTQAEKYLPTELAKVQEQLDEMKAGLEQKEYKAVVATAPRVMKAVNNLIVEAALAKDSFNRKMQKDWTAFATTIPDLIASVDRQILRYTSRGRTPQGMNRDQFKEMVASFDAAKGVWAEAATAGNEGKYELAVTKTNEAKQVFDTVTQALGMQSG